MTPLRRLLAELGEVRAEDVAEAGITLSEGSAAAWLARLVDDGMLLKVGGAYRLIEGDLVEVLP